MNTYSKTFMLKSQLMDISKICPPEISCLHIEIENIPLDFKSKKGSGGPGPPGKWEKLKRPPKILGLPPDIKRITGILNKISDENYDKMVLEAKSFNHVDPEVVTVIFRKVIAEPFFSDIYARLCKSLDDLHHIINEKCIVEFSKTKHKNLGKFIGELYKLDLLDNIDLFLSVLMKDIDEQKLETLCKIITTVGSTDEIFIDILDELDSIKNNFSLRYKFMILDIIEGKI